MSPAAERPLRIVALVARYGEQKYPGALEDLISFYGRVLDREDFVEVLILDNQLTAPTVRELPQPQPPVRAVHLIEGDNQSWEWSAWQKGRARWTDRIARADLIHFVTDAFRNPPSQYLHDIDRALLLDCAQRQFCLGSMDMYVAPREVLGYSVQTWLRTCFFFLSPTALAHLDSVVSVSNSARIFSGNPEAPFCPDAPIDSALRQSFLDWLTGPGQFGVQWHSRFDLTAQTLPFFQAKTTSLLNELLLSARLREAGVPLMDASCMRYERAVRGVLSAASPQPVDLAIPPTDQVRLREELRYGRRSFSESEIATEALLRQLQPAPGRTAGPGAKIAAAVIAADPYALGGRDLDLVQFRISPGPLSDTELLDSGGAPPGRYVGEMLRRLRRLCPDALLYLALNPQLGVPAACLQQVLMAAQVADPKVHTCWVLTDPAQSRPLAYMLRADAVDRCPPVHLGLLSGSDVSLDLAFLHASFGPAACLSIGHVPDVADPANGFLHPVNPALHEATRRATALLLAQPDDAARRALVLSGERTALIGFHAGDVLFLLQALSLEETNFRSVVVPRGYADIVTWVRPDLTALAVDLPVPQRGAYQVADELALLRDYILQLERQGVSTARFFHMVRPILRDHNRTRHHLREIAAFAVGGEGHRLRPVRLLSLAGGSKGTGRVVLQFDAGWMLKGYPKDRRGELLRLLRERGYTPVLLGAPEPDCPDVPARPYTDLAAFHALLGSSDALIGCDSFPTHFAEACGVPTVALFGSTLPYNARGQDTPRYRSLHHPMPCVPCRSHHVCEIDRGDSCRAHAPPWEVVAALEALCPPPPRTARAEEPHA